MKRFLILFCLLALLLAGCAQQSEVFTTEVDGTVYTVDTQAGTITGGGYTCRYTVADDKKSVVIRFPDGATWSESKTESGTISSSGSVGIDRMGIAGDLADILWNLPGSGPNWSGMLASALVFCLGLGMVSKPRAFWWLSMGWLFRDAEPSDRALHSYQIAGSVFMVLSVIPFFISLLQ